MTTQDVLELHRAGWSHDEILTLMRADRQQQVPQQASQQMPQQAPQQMPQQAPQQMPQQAAQQASQQMQQAAQQMPQQAAQESETVQLLREMLGMIRGNNINNIGSESQAVDAAEILAANDYGMEVKR